MTRIIAGVARGRLLSVPARGTRPTSDRVRESLFSSLSSRLASEGVPWAHLDVLDLYAGTGALGLEALSRGARSVVLVESDRSAARTLRANCTMVGLPGAEVVERRVRSLGSSQPPAPAGYSLVFADPPYEVPAATMRDELLVLSEAGWIGRHAVMVVERPARDEACPLPPGWPVLDERRYGDTALWYGRPPGGVVDERAAVEEDR